MASLETTRPAGIDPGERDILSATRPVAHTPNAVPMSPIENPTREQLEAYWDAVIVKPLTSGRMKGRVVTVSGRPLAGIGMGNSGFHFKYQGKFRDAVGVYHWNTTLPEDATFDVPLYRLGEGEELLSISWGQSPYIGIRIQVGAPYHQNVWITEYEAGEHALKGLTFDETFVRRLMARGELMPSTAIEGGVDVVVRRLLDEQEYEEDGKFIPEKLEDVTKGRFEAVIDESKTFDDIKEGDAIVSYQVRKELSQNTETTRLVRVPEDGYYGIVIPQDPWKKDWKNVYGMRTGILLRKGALVGFTRDAFGRIAPSTRKTLRSQPTLPPTARELEIGVDHSAVWTLLCKRPDIR